MLKPYDKPEDIPDELKDHYSRREDGKYHADIPDEHPAVKHNAKLLSEKTAAETKAKDLETQLESAKASGLPRGTVAVPKAEHELLEVVKEAGITKPEEFNTLKTEHADFKTKAEAAEGEKHADKVAEAMGWDKEKTRLLVPAVYDLSQVQVRDAKGGKQEAVAKVKQQDGSFIEKPFNEVATGDAKLAALIPVLTGQQQQRRGNGADPAPAGRATDLENDKSAARSARRAYTSF